MAGDASHGEDHVPGSGSHVPMIPGVRYLLFLSDLNSVQPSGWAQDGEAMGNAAPPRSPGCNPEPSNL